MMARSAMNISNKPRLALDVCDVVLCLVLTAACAYIAAGGFYETLSSLMCRLQRFRQFVRRRSHSRRFHDC